MIFVMSDIHGCFAEYKLMLEKLPLAESDTLYILGDVLDRGKGGVGIINDIRSRKNIKLFRGNHEQLFLDMLKELTENPKETRSARFNDWFYSGGEATLNEFEKLTEEEKSDFIDFLDSLPYFENITVNGEKYLLAHTVPEKRVLLAGKAKDSDFIYGEQDFHLCYYKTKTIVTGHTPVKLIDKNCRGVWKGNNHIAIDCAVAFGGSLACVCLDTNEEFYVFPSEKTDKQA